MPYFVYILECKDKTYYCGWTKNLHNRVLLHNKGTASKYTRSRLPVRVVYFEKKKSLSHALKREIQIKRLSRKEKQKLIH